MDSTRLERQLNDTSKIEAPRTAILWGRADVLGEAVESILTKAKQWQVIKMLGDPDVRVLSQAVEKIKPEIVIVNQGLRPDGFVVPIQLIESFPKLRIIAINPDNNVVEVYKKQEICIEEVSDLLSVIDKYSKSATKGGEKEP